MGRHHSRQLAFFMTLIVCCEVALSKTTPLTTSIDIQPNTSVSCPSLSQCLNCSMAQVCTKYGDLYIQYGIVTCDGDTPYCNRGICSKIPDEDLGCNNNVPCPVDGTLPDPKDCTRYIRCSNFMGTVNQCPRTTVYNHATGICKYRRYVTDCVNFNCNGRENRIVTYPRDQRLYALCSKDGPIILGRCQDYEIFDNSQEKCVRHCTRVDTQPPQKETDCGKYYECVEVSPRQYQPIEMFCACAEGYDEKTKTCSTNATCLKKYGTRCTKNKSDNDTDKSDKIDKFNAEIVLASLIINSGNNNNANSSGNNNNDNKISNGDDSIDGNMVNGNENGNNSVYSNVAYRTVPVTLIINNSGDDNNDNRIPILPYPLIVNSGNDNNADNSGNNNNDNKISNGNDNVTGNIVNGNDNGDNSVGRKKRSVPLILNTRNENNDDAVSNGKDDVDNLIIGSANGDSSNSGNVANDDAEIYPLIVNSGNDNNAGNSGNNNNDNKISNGNDNVTGNIVNGNDNGDNSVGRKKRSVPLILNTRNENNDDAVSNGKDDEVENLIIGSANGDSSNSGNVANDDAEIYPLIINSGNNNNTKSTGNNNNDNKISNGDDSIDGNIINGNNNGNNSGRKKRSVPFMLNKSGNDSINKDSNGNNVGNLIIGNDNSNSGDVANDSAEVYPLIINSGNNDNANSSGNNNNDNQISNGNDSIDGNIVNGNDNGNNLARKKRSVPVPLISNSENESNDDTVSNGDNGNLIIGNANGDGNVPNDGIGLFSIFITLEGNNNDDNSGNKNNDDRISNGKDSITDNSNIVNGNNNGNNSARKKSLNGNDDVILITCHGDSRDSGLGDEPDRLGPRMISSDDGNAASDNNNGKNSNPDNVKNGPPPVDNSESNDNSDDNDASDYNEKNDSGDDYDNSDNNNNYILKLQQEDDSKWEDGTKRPVRNFIRLIIKWIRRIIREPDP